MRLDEDLCAHYLNLDFSENFFTENNEIHVENPYPIHKPLKHSKIDIISKFNEDLEEYNNQLTALGREFQLVKNKILNQKFTNSHATITKGLLNFCNTERHEAPFTCDYNPYYSNGFLEYFNLNGKDYLVRPDCNNNLRITDISNPWKNRKINIEHHFDENITSISSFNNSNELLLLLKHHKEINLLKIKEIKGVAEICQTKKFKRDILDAKLDKTKIGYVSSDLKFHLYDIETHQKKDLKEFNLNTTNRFEFIDDYNIAFLNQKDLRILDLRSDDHRLFQPALNNCNYLCSVKIHDNLVYLATRHHLIRTDVRFFKDVEFCTHLMKHSPCYMDRIDNFLCLSGQKTEEKILFYGRPISSLPTNVPCVSTTLNKCQLEKGVLLRGDIRERLQKSVGGIKLISEDTGVFLYTVNSLGDIFKQKIAVESEFSKTDPVEHLYTWINILPVDVTPLHLTGVVNASEARLTLNKRIEHNQLTKFSKNSKKTTYFLRNFNNRYHKNNLGELASNFVSIWEDVEDEDEERDTVELVPEVAPLDKVSNWIESNYFFD